MLPVVTSVTQLLRRADLDTFEDPRPANRLAEVAGDARGQATRAASDLIAGAARAFGEIETRWLSRSVAAGAGQGEARYVDVLASRPASRFALDTVVQGIALDGDAAGLGDQAANFGDGRFLRRLSAGFMVDLFVDNRAVKIVGPERQGDLGRLQPKHDPVGFDVWEIVEHQAADRHDLQVHQSGRLWDVGHLRVIGVERQRDKGLEPAGLGLKLAQADQVVDAVVRLVDMAVEHGRVRMQAESVRRAMNIQPALSRGLRAADLLANLVGSSRVDLQACKLEYSIVSPK